ncbi:MAG: hypothetical protein ACE5HT_17020 [Gemmatimonadales bacterium]
MRRPIWSKALWIALATFVFLGAFVAMRYGTDIRARYRDNGYVPHRQGKSGLTVQLVMVFLASAACDVCNRPELPPLVEQIKLALASYADSQEIGFAAVGIGVDRDVVRSASELQRFGLFDEIIGGNSWDNTGAIKYLWREFPGPGSVPQIVVVERRLPDELDLQPYGSYEERLLARYVGIGELQRWVRNGVVIAR